MELKNRVRESAKKTCQTMGNHFLRLSMCFICIFINVYIYTVEVFWFVCVLCCARGCLMFYVFRFCFRSVQNDAVYIRKAKLR